MEINLNKCKNKIRYDNYKDNIIACFIFSSIFYSNMKLFGNIAIVNRFKIVRK